MKQMKNIFNPQLLIENQDIMRLQQNKYIRRTFQYYSEFEQIDYRDSLNFIQNSFQQSVFQLELPADLFILLRVNYQNIKFYIDNKQLVIKSDQQQIVFQLRQYQQTKIIEFHDDDCILQAQKQFNFGIINKINELSSQNLNLTSESCFISNYQQNSSSQAASSAIFDLNSRKEIVLKIQNQSLTTSIQNELKEMGEENIEADTFLDLVGQDFPAWCIMTKNLILGLPELEQQELEFESFSNFDEFIQKITEVDDI